MSLSPVIFSIGPVSIYLYSLACVLGIVFAHWYLHKLDNQKIFTKNFYDSLLTALIIGIILGGSLGYVLIYDLVLYISNPIEILKTWEGGMSFHGGAIGVLVAVIISCRKHNIPIFYTLDLISCGVPIGLLLGRIDNFINGELFGRVTNMPWGMVFPEIVIICCTIQINFIRHFFDGALLFVVVNSLFFLTKMRLYYGATAGIAVIWYGIAPFVVEIFREPDYQICYLWFDLTMI